LQVEQKNNSIDLFMEVYNCNIINIVYKLVQIVFSVIFETAKMTLSLFFPSTLSIFYQKFLFCQKLFCHFDRQKE